MIMHDTRAVRSGGELYRLALFGILIVSIPWAIKFSAAALLIASLGLLVPFVKDIPKSRPPFIFVQLGGYVLFIAILALVRDGRIAGKYLETISPLLALPLLFLIHRDFVVRNRSLLLGIYIVTISITMLVCLAMGLYVYWNEFYIFVNGYDPVTELIGMHSAYLSLFVSFAFFALLDMFLTNMGSLSWTRRTLTVVWLVFLAFCVLYIRSRMGLVSFVLVLLLVLTFRLPGFHKVTGVVALGVILAVILVLVETTGFNKGRFELPQLIKHAKAKQVQWNASWEVFKGNPLFGVGPLGAQDNLNVEYERIGFAEGVEFNYNSHNQYLSCLVVGGIFGAFLLLWPLIVVGTTSMRNGHMAAMCLVLLIGMSFIAESMLERHKGVLFYGFFLGFFYVVGANRFEFPLWTTKSVAR